MEESGGFMHIKKLHGWKLTYGQAVALQKRLACEIKFRPLRTEPKLIAGLDCAFTKDGQKIIAVAVVLEWPGLEIVETTHAVKKVTMPYIPGLLSFREGPVCLGAVEKLKTSPDLFIIDGQGIAHPRRLGLAAHLGLFFDKPTIGCAKSRLIGISKEPSSEKGSYSLLKDKDEIIGAVVRTRSGVKPIFVSVGNKCILDDAIRWTLNCAAKYRLPEPTRLADKLVCKLKQRL